MPDDKAWEMLIEHQKRCWDAEKENAERLVGRMKLMSAIAAVIFGIGLFKFDWLYNPGDVSRLGTGAALWIIRALLTVSLICMGYAFWLVTKPSRPRRKPNASGYMILRSGAVRNPPQTADEAGAVVFSRLYRASISLMLRNLRVDVRLRWAVRWFFAGAGFAFLAILLFIWLSVPPTAADTRNGQHDANAGKPPADAATPGSPGTRPGATGVGSGRPVGRSGISGNGTLPSEPQPSIPILAPSSQDRDPPYRLDWSFATTAPTTQRR